MSALAQPLPSFDGVNPRDALRGAFLIFDAWKLSGEDIRLLLGSPPERTFYAWKKGEAARLSHDTLRRIGYVAGIFKALQILYTNQALADGWLTRPNRAFGNRAPLDRLRGGDITDLAAVRAYLDAARAPWS
jgi:uncharacterized protein (DUF2384 family)